MKNSKKIALSGISTAFASIFLALGNTLSVLDYSFYLLASLCILIPLVTKEVRWCFFSFAVSGTIGILFVPNIMAMFAYIAFFGAYALIYAVLRLKNKIKWLDYLVKNIFYIISITLMYFFSTIFIDINSWNLPMEILFIGAFLIMNFYDFLMRRIIRVMEATVSRLMNKY